MSRRQKAILHEYLAVCMAIAELKQVAIESDENARRPRRSRK